MTHYQWALLLTQTLIQQYKLAGATAGAGVAKTDKGIQQDVSQDVFERQR